MTRGAALLVAAFVAAFALFLLATAPASLVAHFAPPALTLDGLSGSVWHGRAQRAAWRGVPLGAAEWTLSPLGLLTLAARGELTVTGAAMNLQAGVSHGLFNDRFTVRDARGTIPLALLSQISGAQGPLDATAVLDGVSLTVDGNRVTDAGGRVTLADTRVTRPQPVALGAFTLDLSAADGWLQADVNDDGGPLGVSGRVRATPDRRWDIDARVRARDADSDLARALSLLARPDADGQYALQLSGTY